MTLLMGTLIINGVGMILGLLIHNTDLIIFNGVGYLATTLNMIGERHD